MAHKITAEAIREAHANLFNDLIDVCIERFNNATGIVYYLDFVNKFWDNTMTAMEKAVIAEVGYTKKDFVAEFTNAIAIR
ncbi:MAG: hypothetical protein IKS23_01260 [Alphaproteobacteria bacterium]|nr:hypothetical protein [Alphaproteobacteria bacterium]